MEVELYLLVGVVLSILFTELTVVSPGGVIVPGYIALFWDDPPRIVATLGIAMVTLLLVRLLDRVVILYGRRRFASAIVLSFALRGLLAVALPAPQTTIGGLSAVGTAGATVIGWLVPAIIAVDMDRQGPGITIASMAGVSALVRLVVEMWL